MVVLGQTYTASQSGNAFNIGSGEYDFTFVLDKNADTGKLTVTTELPVTYPETVFAIGNLDGKDFAPTSTMALTTVDVENGLYEGTINLTGAQVGEFGYFAFCTAEGADWANLGNRYGPQEIDTEVSLGEAMPLFGGDNSFKAPVGKYKVAVDLKNTIVTVTEVVNSFDVVYLVGNIDGTEFIDNLTTHPLTLKEHRSPHKRRQRHLHRHRRGIHRQLRGCRQEFLPALHRHRRRCRRLDRRRPPLHGREPRPSSRVRG